MKLIDCFRFNGNLQFDPYRVNEKNYIDMEMYNMIFDEDGDVKLEVLPEIKKLIKEYNWDIMSDAVRLLYAADISSFTSGNYSSIYAWR